jgi:hypothetical protein
MSEVCEQTPHTATLGVQRGKIREWICFFRIGVHLGRMWLHAAFLRLPLAD